MKSSRILSSKAGAKGKPTMLRKGFVAIIIAVLVNLMTFEVVAARNAAPPKHLMVHDIETDITYRLSLGTDTNKVTVEKSPLRSPGERDWKHVLTMSVNSEFGEYYLSFESSEDTFEIWAPHQDGFVIPGSLVTVAANGRSAVVGLEQFAMGDADIPPTSGSEKAEAGQTLMRGMKNPEGFMASVVEFGQALNGMDQVATPNSWNCVACAAALIAYGVSLAALVIACGGPISLGCILAFVALSLDKIGALASCLACHERPHRMRPAHTNIRKSLFSSRIM